MYTTFLLRCTADDMLNENNNIHHFPKQKILNLSFPHQIKYPQLCVFVCVYMLYKLYIRVYAIHSSLTHIMFIKLFKLFRV